MDIKISIMGAGSAAFSLKLIRDICLTPSLEHSTISLMDIDQERLDAAYALCRRYADEMGVRLQIEKTTDRREALRGADFVINTALVAGHRRLQEGWAIARRYGYRFGGSYHIMHDEAFWINFYQFRLFDAIIRDILEICPEAWYIQIANPVLAGITYLGRKYREAKIVGLCHGFSGVYHIAEVLGLDKDRLHFQIPGVNHFVWLTHLYHEGQDVFPTLDEWIEREAPKYWATCRPSSDLGPKAVDLYKRFGAFPIGDTCTPGGGAWPWWYHTDVETERRWREDPEGWWGRYFSSLERRIQQLHRIAHDSSAKVTEAFPPEKSGESIIPL
ncbi:MAG TPA: alpha-glucosidase/alpha-galactosidase, partial [Caldilineae bacterium]|nr:alpha-glucosidase/alpha-galactosidase [Caldilineae bacterium]